MIGGFEIDALKKAYHSGSVSPTEVVSQAYARIAQRGVRPAWIELVPERELRAATAKIERQAGASDLPLFGIPFAVKDNIDVAGMPTTAGCPAFAYTPVKSATVVERIVAAGAILIGKTNLDQFATGLVGVRSPYGACSSVFDERYISGGSSSGSAVAVASGQVSFALGTDTAGSGRVPAACNSLIGLKPTQGAISTAGVVPACRSLDCVSILAQTCEDALTVLRVAAGFDPLDPFSRTSEPGAGAAPWLSRPFRFGVPRAEQLEFFGDEAARLLFERAMDRLGDVGGVAITIDFTPFHVTADLLYSGPWVAERLAALGEFASTHADAMDPTVGAIIRDGWRYSAVDAWRARYRLAELRRATESTWNRIDVLLLPTTGTTYTIDEVKADPVRLNTNLGHYTNFVNLLDLAAVAVPAGFRENGLPFGVSLIGPAWTETALLSLSARFQGTHELTRDATPVGCVLVAVVGAHLTGQPLNYQLTERKARLVKTCRTARGYRLYALGGTQPLKPGLVRDPSFAGPGIELEIWAMPENHFGGFVAAVPPPLSIGSVELGDGSMVQCFLCEPYALSNAEEITLHGSWRKYLEIAGQSAG